MALCFESTVLRSCLVGALFSPAFSHAIMCECVCVRKRARDQTGKNRMNTQALVLSLNYILKDALIFFFFSSVAPFSRVFTLIYKSGNLILPFRDRKIEIHAVNARSYSAMSLVLLVCLF